MTFASASSSFRASACAWSGATGDGTTSLDGKNGGLIKPTILKVGRNHITLSDLVDLQALDEAKVPAHTNGHDHSDDRSARIEEAPIAPAQIAPQEPEPEPQGEEPVVVPVRRNFYTAITRAREHCTVFFDALSMAKSTKYQG
jgi:hypothetical protein